MSVNARNGITVNTASVIDGISGLSSVDGIALASGLASFSDNFNRADSASLGANWTEIAGNIDIVSNEANAPIDFTFNPKSAVYSAVSCNTLDQYIKVTFSANTVLFAQIGVVMRYVDAISVYYEIRFDDANDAVAWYTRPTAGGAETLVGSVALAVSFPMTIGIVVTGTGNATIINVWTNPTADAPTSASLWDGAAPTVSLSNNPASPADIGGYLGLAGLWNGGALAWDNFFGGDVP